MARDQHEPTCAMFKKRCNCGVHATLEGELRYKLRDVKLEEVPPWLHPLIRVINDL